METDFGPGDSISRSVDFLGVATDMQLVQDTRNRYNEEVQVYELTGGVELVPLLTSRRYYSQPQSTRYVATDATRPGYTIESYVWRENEIWFFVLESSEVGIASRPSRCRFSLYFFFLVIFFEGNYHETLR